MITGLEIKEIISREFGDCLKPMKDISWDSSNKVALVDIMEQFHCYDDIVQKFYQGEKLDKKTEDQRHIENPRSPDMILFKEDFIFFIEFKNGKIDEKVKDNIKAIPLRFGLAIYKGPFFKDVRTFSPKNFKKWFDAQKFTNPVNQKGNNIQQ